ncbi:MAG: hypothetical protein OXC06_07860 [Acidimicrobiaceae bacterium]|nr:hypothetical protein [Acidimicrobiaceae bacterium]
MTARLPRLRTALAIVASLAFVAAACGGEVSVSIDDDAAAPTTEAPSAAEPDAAEPADSGAATDEAPATTEPADSGAATDEDPAAAEPADETETEATDDETAAPEPADETAADEETTTTAPAEPEGPPPNIYEDPRGGIFAEYQASMDRGDHPFMQIDQFCVAHDPTPGRVDTDAGITADSISLVHMRSQLENLAMFGFATDVGDPKEIFETFVTVVNEQCGGVRGRMIDLHLLEHDPVSPDVEADMNADCIAATEDLNGVILLNTTGFQGSATLCIVEDHETAFLTVQPQSEEFMRRGQDRLVITTLTAEESLGWLALDLIAQGALDGKTIGVAAPTTPGQYEAVEAGLVNTLRDNGANVAVFDTIECDGRVCAGGVSESVQNLRNAGVDVFFNVLNTLSAPGYIQEMVNQGYQPGDVQFYASDFNSQAAELVASKIALFGGHEAGELYNGAILLDSRDTGSYRLEGYQPHAFNEMCADTYGANSPSGADHESEDRYDGNSRYGMVGSVCELLRIALRAIYDAGDNPTRDDIYETLANLGPVDSNEMHPASIRPGKTRAPDVIHNLIFRYPCGAEMHPFPIEGLDDGVCIYPIDEYRPAPS